MNKETLEEAKKYAELSYYGDEVDAFVRGVKWQAERTYTEAEIQQVLDGFTNEAPGQYIKTNFIDLLKKQK